MDEKRLDELQSELNISMAFIKAAEEVKQKEAEREERNRKKAAEAAEKRRKEIESEQAYREYRKYNPPTERECEEARRGFFECLKEVTGVDYEESINNKKEDIIYFQVRVTHYDRSVVGVNEIVTSVQPDIKVCCGSKIPDNYISAEHPEDKEDITYNGISVDYYYFDSRAEAELFIKNYK